MREIKRLSIVFFMALFAVSVMIGVLYASDAEFLQGGIKKGAVAVMDHDGQKYVALDDMLSALGFAQTPAKGGLVSTFSGKKIEFWGGSAAARVNGMVCPMPGPVFEKNGHWWGEANASLQAMSQFLASAGRPSDLKFDFSPGKGTGTEQKTPTPIPPRPEPTPSATPQTPVLPPPTTTNPSQTASAGSIALLSQVRWGEQPNAYRAVVDISRPVDVKVTHKSGEIDVAFPDTTSPTIKNDSPWTPLSVSSRQSSSTVVLTFRHGAKNVKSFWLEDPPRYVMDFYFDGQATPAAAEVAPSTTESPSVSTPPSRPSTPSSPPASNKRPLVVVDAGHGGHDPGAVGNGLREKDINLKAALELEASLKKLGMDVKLSRRDDRYLKLEERTAFANSNNADIFISLHCNALPKGKHATGVELYLMADSTDKDALNLAILENRELSGNAQNAAEVNAAADKKTKLLLMILGDMQQNDKINESTALAEHLYERMRASGLSIRKVRQAPFFVLKGAGMPALLVEMGYITERSDANQLNSAAHRKKMMDATALGISNYLKRGSREGGR
ncbi:N-acetylmuramoyl-L-alanine amidase [Synergistaceae bacterium OttesenSCG-928-I11]|nr:N-acetylmuramoyl-L-alanine amidase [Synergistaceae bacterium OttesenSCG-928-I11]